MNRIASFVIAMLVAMATALAATEYVKDAHVFDEPPAHIYNEP